jgi:hypothetical protein
MASSTRLLRAALQHGPCVKHRTNSTDWLLKVWKHNLEPGLQTSLRAGFTTRSDGSRGATLRHCTAQTPAAKQLACSSFRSRSTVALHRPQQRAWQVQLATRIRCSCSYMTWVAKSMLVYSVVVVKPTNSSQVGVADKKMMCCRCGPAMSVVIEITVYRDT